MIDFIKDYQELIGAVFGVAGVYGVAKWQTEKTIKEMEKDRVFTIKEIEIKENNDFASFYKYSMVFNYIINLVEYLETDKKYTYKDINKEIIDYLLENQEGLNDFIRKYDNYVFYNEKKEYIEFYNSTLNIISSLNDLKEYAIDYDSVSLIYEFKSAFSLYKSIIRKGFYYRYTI